MPCQIFKGAKEGFCLRENCRYYNQDTGECVYETLQYLSKKHKENREGRLNSEAKPDFCNIKVGKSPK
jgi:hypothetical protein